MHDIHTETLPLLQLDGRAACIHHPLTSDPDPWASVASGRLPLTPLIPSPPPGVAGLGVPGRETRDKVALKGTPALHQGLWLGEGGDCSTHPAGLQSQMEAQVGPPEGLRTLGRGTVGPDPPRSTSRQ